MTLVSFGSVCLGTAFALHTFVMLSAPYGVGMFQTSKDSTDKACQAMMNSTFFMYGFAFMLSLHRGPGEDVTSSTKDRGIVVAVMAVIGVACFVSGMVVFAVNQQKDDYHDSSLVISYHVCIYTMAAIFALYGALAAFKDSRIQRETYPRLVED